jgi:hypothetical protein
MATSPIGASSPPVENQFIRKNEDVKPTNQQIKVEVKPPVQAAPQPQENREVEPPKPPPNVNTSGQVTGTTINTTA